MIAALGARVHLYVRPDYRERFTALFRDVLNCTVREIEFGLAHPILLVSFPDGSAFSVEFSDEAPAEPAIADDAHAPRGAWIEFRVNDVSAVQTALRGAGVRSFFHTGSTHEYFMAPGGQVFRVIALDYTGP
jgi:hypothetical protein